MKNTPKGDTTPGKKKRHIGRSLALGALAGGVVATYYFYASKNAKQHRKQATRWSLQFKKEVIKQIESAKATNQTAVASAIDKAAEIFENLRAVDRSELLDAARELKAHWRELSQDIAKEGARSIRSVKKSLKRVAGSDKKRTR